MFRRSLLVASYSFIVTALLSGCVVRTYPLTRDRVDQDLSTGNRGYLKGQSASAETVEKKSTRTTHVVEIELRSPIKFEKATTETKEQVKEGKTLQGNSVSMDMPAFVTEETFQKYTVQKGDTLQKISQKFFGTNKKYLKIYEANKDVLKAPNNVYPGQTLKIPSVQGAPKGNFK